MEPVPVAEYPLRLMDLVSELRQRHFTEAEQQWAELDPDLAVRYLAAMYAEILGRLERSLGLAAGGLMPRLRREYAAVAQLTAEGVVVPPEFFGGPRRERRGA